ncbi:MAG: SpoIIE family protein phosphatase [Candidatus Marinimicrobia bacterium]|nr:SpoIIE family protein phosphatase [Candidatus Neomarinimicrobiota bacterium]
MNILIADDDKISRMLLRRQLEKLGYDVIAAKDGNEAWKLFKANDFSLVISDWMMPGLSGIEFVQKLRRKKQKDYVYFILLTAKQSTEDLIEGLDAGADDFIRKPFHKEELRVRVMSGERIINLERSLKNQNERLVKLNQAMLMDLQAASRVQQSLLPKSLPEGTDYNFDYIYKPCTQLGGDTLNILRLNETKIAINLTDVSGHGVSAALLAFSLSRILSLDEHNSILFHPKNTKTNEREIRTPLEVIQVLNQSFAIEDLENQYFTIIYGILDLEKNTFSYVSAGHPGILFIDGKGRPEIFHSTGLAVGFCKDCPNNENTLYLDDGAKIYLYSDGINEASDQNSKYFGHQKILSVLRSQNDNKLKSRLENIIESAARFQDNPEFGDDISIIGFERKEKCAYSVNRKDNNLQIKLKSELSLVNNAIEDIIKFVNEYPLNISKFNLNLVCREAINNAIIHGNKNNTDKNVFIKITLTFKSLIIEIMDEGSGFDWKKIKKKEFTGFQENGMGMVIMTQNGFNPTYNKAGNILTLTYNI